jgi:hypothetical protein
MLSGIAADASKVVQGNAAPGWMLATLPLSMQTALEKRASDLGYRNTEHLLCNPPPAAETKVNCAPAPAPEGDRFAELRKLIADLPDKSDLTEAEQQEILSASIERYAALVDVGHSAKAVKKGLFDVLWTSGVRLAVSRNALRMMFARKFEQWRKSGRRLSALEDRRPKANRDRCLVISEEDRDMVVGHAVIGCGGRVSQAWRECVDRGWLSDDLRNRFLSNPSSKSHVPASIRNAVAREVLVLASDHHGPRGTRDNGAYIDRYWGRVPALAWYCMDDATLPVYFYVPDGNGWFTLMRGQFLLAIDTRSTCILGYALLPERNYNARAIRSLITRVCDQYGLPRRGFYFERGIWEKSKLLKGASGVPIEWSEIETGLCQFGLVFKHAIRARSKPVERVLGALQNLMEAEPGYAGRDEMHEKFEPFRRLTQRVDRRDLKPEGHFYSMEQWDDRLNALCKQYNAEVQQGKMTMGLSPEEAMERFKDHSDPAVHFDARCRYLLACDKRIVRARKNGITIREGGQAYNYRNEDTGKARLRGEPLIAWIDFDAPEVLTVTDINRENAFCVARSSEVDALDAHPELLGQEMKRIEDHMRPARTRYRILKSKHAQKFRPLFVGRDTLELGQKIAAGRAAAVERQDHRKRAEQAYGGLGIEMPKNVRPEQIDSAEKLRAMLSQEQAP